MFNFFRCRRKDGTWNRLIALYVSHDTGKLELIGNAEESEYQPETLTQFIGLTDATGMRIFFGDILMNRVTQKIYHVEADEPEGLILLRCLDHPCPANDTEFTCVSSSDFIIVGNRFEDPELMNGEMEALHGLET